MARRVTGFQVLLLRTLTFTTILLVTIASSLFLALSLPLGGARISTEVSGLITSSTTWTKTGGPYILVGPVILSSGVTLTIQPGTSVILGSYYLLINGTLRAQGTTTDPISIQGGGNGLDSRGNPIYPITFTPYSGGWNEQAGTGCLIENAILRSTSIYIAASPKVNYSPLTGRASKESTSTLC